MRGYQAANLFSVVGWVAYLVAEIRTQVVISEYMITMVLYTVSLLFIGLSLLIFIILGIRELKSRLMLKKYGGVPPRVLHSSYSFVAYVKVTDDSQYVAVFPDLGYMLLSGRLGELWSGELEEKLRKYLKSLHTAGQCIPYSRMQGEIEGIFFKQMNPKMRKKFEVFRGGSLMDIHVDMSPESGVEQKVIEND